MLKKSEQTRETIRDAALRLFRKKGVEATTMREIAAEAGVATGLAYRYFPSKDSIVFGVYTLHTQRVDAALEKKRRAGIALSPGARLACVLDAEVDALTTSHRRLLRALAQSVMNADSPTWLFAPETTALFRAHAQAQMSWVLEHAPVDGSSDEARDVLVQALWALRLAILYFAVHDPSPGHSRTRALIAEVAPLLDAMMPLLPLAAPGLEAVARVLRLATATATTSAEAGSTDDATTDAARPQAMRGSRAKGRRRAL